MTLYNNHPVEEHVSVSVVNVLVEELEGQQGRGVGVDLHGVAQMKTVVDQVGESDQHRSEGDHRGAGTRIQKVQNEAMHFSRTFSFSL